MRATEILQSEHRVIEQVLSCLEKMTDQALAEGRLEGQSASEALEFLKVFADGCHHHKEEDLLFPLLEAKGFPRQGGPTGVMLHEHEEGRKYIAAMQASLLGAAQGHQPELCRFVAHARAYVELLRQHIFKENHRLFPMADLVCSFDDDARMLQQFAHVEEHDLEQGTHEKYLQLANRLAERFEVPLAAPTPCGCGHGPGPGVEACAASPRVAVTD